MLRAQIEGLPVGIVQEGIKRTPLVVRGDSSIADFDNLQITLPNGEHIPISAIASINEKEGVVSIGRERGQRFAVVRSNVEGRDLVGFVEEVKQQVAEKVKLPIGYTVAFGGQFENQQRAAATLSVVIPVSLGLIFLLLFTTFDRRGRRYWFFPISLGDDRRRVRLVDFRRIFVSACIVGFIALLGIAVLNGVVMVSYFNQLLVTGMAMAKVVSSVPPGA